MTHILCNNIYVFIKFISFLLVFTACTGTESSSTISEEEIQSRIDSAVEMALVEAEEEFNKKLFKATSTTTTLAPTTTTTTLAPTTTNFERISRWIHRK